MMAKTCNRHYVKSVRKWLIALRTHTYLRARIHFNSELLHASKCGAA